MTSRHSLFILILSISFSALLVAPSTVTALPENGYVRPWMCLERCGATSKDVQTHLGELRFVVDVVSAVSFELYNLGDNSQLITIDNVTHVAPALVEMGYKTYPMLSSFPYPPEFLDWMRRLFKNPKPFTDALISEASKHGHAGYNVDFEPTSNATEQDAIDYANWLSYLSDELHKHNIAVSVDVGSWSKLWNFTLLAASSVDHVECMSTYAGPESTWDKALEHCMVLGKKLIVGLETTDPTTGKPLTHDRIMYRLNKLSSVGITNIGIWKCPLDIWVDALREWK